MTVDEQYAVIRQASFFTALRNQARAVRDALAGVSATAPTVSFAVEEVPVTVTFAGEDMLLHVGDPAAAPQPALYVWQAPAAWLDDTTTATA